MFIHNFFVLFFYRTGKPAVPQDRRAGTVTRGHTVGGGSEAGRTGRGISAGEGITGTISCVCVSPCSS